MKKLETALQITRKDGFRDIISRVWDKVNKLEFIEFGLRGLILPYKITHIHGPSVIDYEINELIVICVVRNGEMFIKSFIEHYKSMRVKHFVFLDNGSSDGTVKILCSSSNITVLKTPAPYRRYENTMKRYLAKKYSMGRWCICADIDELFDYPSSKVLQLKDFLYYLNVNQYNAVVTQMLDMFSDTPLAHVTSLPGDDLREKYRYYDISAIKKFPYDNSPNKMIRMYFGGVRSIIFGTNNCLTKVSLIFMDGKLQPFVKWHHTRNANLADVSCVLMHYPFVGAFFAKVKEAAQSGRYGLLTTDEYKSYYETLRLNFHINMKLETARTFTDVNELLASEFIVVSDKYIQWVHSQALRAIFPKNLTR